MEFQEIATLAFSRQRIASEGHQAQAAYSDGDKQQIDGSPGNPCPPSVKAEFHRLTFNATRNLEHFAKFLTIFGGTLLVQSACLRVSTIILAMMDPSYDYEWWSTVLLHIVTSVITFLLSYYNQSSSCGCGLRTACGLKTICDSVWLNFILNVLCLAKPIHYFVNYRKRSSCLKIITDEQINNSGTDVTKRSLDSLVELTECELKDSRVNMFEVYLQLIPMGMLEAYLLFHTSEHAKMCSFRDFFRLVPIIMPFFIAVRETCAFESAKWDLEQALYIKEYYKSGERHGMVVYPEYWMGIVQLTNFVQNLCTVVLRFYAATYFLVLSPWLCLFYIVLLFLVNLGILSTWPQHLLSIHQNPPFGLSTTASYWFDRILNIFCNIGTRFAVFTNSKNKFPLCLVQVFHFGIPLSLTFLLQQLMTSANVMPQPKANSTAICPDNGEFAKENYFPQNN